MLKTYTGSMPDSFDGWSEKRRYHWPLWLLAAVLVFLALAIVWVSFAAHRESQERNFNPPTTGGAK